MLYALLLRLPFMMSLRLIRPCFRPEQLIIRALACACTVLASVHARAGAALQAEYDPPLRWVAWDAAGIETLKTNSDDQKRSTKGLLDGKPGTSTFFGKVEGSVTTIRFNQSRDIAR